MLRHLHVRSWPNAASRDQTGNARVRPEADDLPHSRQTSQALKRSVALMVGAPALSAN